MGFNFAIFNFAGCILGSLCIFNYITFISNIFML